MIIYLVHIVLYINYIYIKAEPALPSYDLDSGEWPADLSNNDQTVANLMDRWFIDKKDVKCKPFEYRGTKGNFNNFPSQKLCERHLNAELTQVEKLQGCTLKPTNQNEHHGGCTDNTNNLSDKYYFNKDDGSCNSFKYNGCGGTFNRYDSIDECKSYCLNSKNGGVNTNSISSKLQNDDAKYTLPNYLDCHLKPDVKKPNPETKVIALVKEKKCVYASVDEELGRGYFGTLRDCVKKCFPHAHSDTNETNEPEMQRKIEACDKENPFQVALSGDSTETVVRYYYKKSDKKCKRFETAPNSSGVNDFDKSKNSFPTLDLCHSYCGTETYPDTITPEKTCQEPKKGDSTNGTDGTFSVTRYYYLEENNGQVKKCKAFTFYGIDGNTNNFKTMEQCKKICGENMRPGDTITEDTNTT